MSGPSPDGAPTGGRPVPRRRRWVAATVVAAVLAAALVVLTAVLGGGDDATAAGDAGAVTSAAGGPAAAPPAGDPAAPAEPSVDEPPVAGAPSGAPAPPDAGGTGDPNQAPPSLPAVPLDAAVPVQGVTASLARIESIDGTATGPGNVDGPALRVTVRLENGTGGDVDLDGVVVDLVHGSARTPASPLDDPSQLFFSGTVPAGEAVQGVYVFSVPEDGQDDVTVGVGFAAGAPIAVFSGSPG